MQNKIKAQIKRIDEKRLKALQAMGKAFLTPTQLGELKQMEAQLEFVNQSVKG